MRKYNLLKRECGYSAAADAKTASHLKRDREQTMLFFGRWWTVGGTAAI